jgi:hypothetical protein
MQSNISTEPIDESNQQSEENNNQIQIKKDDYVLVKYVGKKSTKYFLGMVLGKLNDHEEEEFWKVNFLRASTSSRETNVFQWPHKVDYDEVSIDDIILKVSPPIPTRRDNWKFCDPALNNFSNKIQ